jgi:hypothetical protein
MPSVSLPFLALAAGFLLGTAAITASASSPSPSQTYTKGPIPQAAYLSNGEIDPKLVPDFVPVWGRDGTSYAGYVPKAFALGLSAPTKVTGRPVDPDWPVYADDLKTLVGYMVPDKGFVPLGVDRNKVPSLPAEVAPAQ